MSDWHDDETMPVRQLLSTATLKVVVRVVHVVQCGTRSYVDSRKPSDLADFGQHWNQGKAWWNESVSKMWGAVNQPAPTV